MGIKQNKFKSKAASEIFSDKDLKSFASCVVQVERPKTFSGSYFFTCEYRNVRFFTKLYFYYKSSEELAAHSNKYQYHADVEIKVLEALKREIIDKGISPCIMEMVYYKIVSNTFKYIKNINCETKIIEELPKNFLDDLQVVFCKYNAMVKENLARPKCAFIVLERYHMSINQFFIRVMSYPFGIPMIKSMIFQIIAALYAIKKIFPKFRHRDLHADNVMIKIDSDFVYSSAEPRFLLYKIDGKKYYVPFYGIWPKIIDFGFAQIPELGIVSNIARDKRLMYERPENDILILLHNLWNVSLNFPAEKITEIDTFLTDVEPQRTFAHFFTSHISKIKHNIYSYREMLFKASCWNEYLKYEIDQDMVLSKYNI